MELTVAGGYFIPGKTPQVINKVKDLITLGYVPYGTPTYNEASGWVSQLMVKGYGGSATDYTLTTGYLDKTPYFPATPPVGGSWVLLGSLLARSNNFYVHAWLNGVAAGPLIDISSGTTGTLPISRGGTGATTAANARTNLALDRIAQASNETAIYSPNRGTKIIVENGTWGAFDITNGAYLALPVNRGGTGALTAADARTNLGLGTTNDVTFNSVTSRKRNTGTSAFIAQGVDGYTPASSFTTQMYAADTTTLLGQGEFRANNNGTLQIINRSPDGVAASYFWTFGRDGTTEFPGGATIPASAGRPLILRSVNPAIQFEESDTGKVYVMVSDSSGLRINADSTSGPTVWSYSGTTSRLQLPGIDGNIQLHNGGTASLGVITTGGGTTAVGTRNQFEVTTAASFYLVRRNTDNTTGQYVINFPTSAGTLALTGTSGVNFKHDITDADLLEAVDRIDALRMVNFVYNDDEQNRQRFGIIAEEAEIPAPQYIKHREEMYECDIDENGSSINQKFRDRPFVDVNPIVMDLLGYIKHLSARVAELEEKLK